MDGHEVSFPLWVKALAWIVGLCFPLAVASIAWLGTLVVEMKIDIATMKTAVEFTSEDRYRASQAIDAHARLEGMINRNAQDIAELQGSKK